jgi:hypothetical protein
MSNEEAIQGGEHANPITVSTVRHYAPARFLVSVLTFSLC